MDKCKAYPDRKISETFLRFAAPLLESLPRDAPEHHAQQALQVSFTAWNAVLFAVCSTTTGIWKRFDASRTKVPRPPCSWNN
jgi:hypothetical protein